VYEYERAAFVASYISNDTVADTSTPRTCACPVEPPSRSSPGPRQDRSAWAWVP